MYDSLKWDSSLGHSTSANQISFAWVESARLESLLNMYDATHDKKYLLTLVQSIGNIIDRRDDLRTQIGLAPNPDYRGVADATWANTYYNDVRNVGAPYAHLIHSANIVYPMIRFAADVRSNAQLGNIISAPGGRYGAMSFSRIAEDLVNKTIETLRAHEDQWSQGSENDGFYKERCGEEVPIPLRCTILPMNMHSAVGRVFLHLFRATGEAAYLERTKFIANYIKNSTSIDRVKNAKKWRYWGYNGSIDLRDDISHGSATAAFPYECYKYSIMDKGKLIFDHNDMIQYANSFTKTAYEAPLRLYSGIDYPNQLWNLKTGRKQGNAVPGVYECNRWLPFAEFQPEITQIILDNFTSSYYRDMVSKPEHPVSLALLAKYGSHLSPFASNHSLPEEISWITATILSGKDGEDRIFAASGAGILYLLETVGDEIIKKDSLVVDDGKQWQSLTSGNFFPSGEQNEVAAFLRDSTSSSGVIYFLSLAEGLQIIDTLDYDGRSSGSEKIVAGDFVAGGGDELIIVTQDGELRLYNQTGPDLTWIFQTVPGVKNVTATAAGNFLGSPLDQLVTLRITNGGQEVRILDISSPSMWTCDISVSVMGKASSLLVSDLDANGIDEVIIQIGSELQTYVACGDRLCLGPTETFPGKQIQNSIILAGNFNTRGSKRQLLMLRNCDGGVVAYDVLYKSFARLIRIEQSEESETPKVHENNGNKPVSEQKETFTPKMTAYPNPTSGVLDIQMMDEDEQKPFEYYVYDIHGKVVLSGWLQNNGQTIMLTYQPNGIYILKLAFGGQLIDMRRIILKR